MWLQKVILLSKKPFNNVKEVSGISLITLWWANKLAEMYPSLHTCITSRVKGSHHFRAQNGLKNIFYEKTIFSGKIYFSCTSSPISGSKSWQWPKVNLGAVKYFCSSFMLRATFRFLVEFLKFFQKHVSVNLISK